MGDEQSTSSKQKQTYAGPKGSKITTKYVNPPIPVRHFDWCAWYGDWDGDPDDTPDRGWGLTELEAVQDLIYNQDEPEHEN